MFDFPLTPGALATITGAAIFAVLMTEWLKAYLKDWRFTNLLALALTEAAVILAQFITSAWRPSAEQVYAAVLVAFFGVTLATFGYETITNLLGKLGFGKRAP